MKAPDVWSTAAPEHVLSDFHLRVELHPFFRCKGCDCSGCRANGWRGSAAGPGLIYCSVIKYYIILEIRSYMIKVFNHVQKQSHWAHNRKGRALPRSKAAQGGRRTVSAPSQPKG